MLKISNLWLPSYFPCQGQYKKGFNEQRKGASKKRPLKKILLQNNEYKIGELCHHLIILWGQTHSALDWQRKNTVFII